MQNSWFYWSPVQDMCLHALPEAVLYQARGKKVEVPPRHWYKETRNLVINTVPFL